MFRIEVGDGPLKAVAGRELEAVRPGRRDAGLGSEDRVRPRPHGAQRHADTGPQLAAEARLDDEGDALRLGFRAAATIRVEPDESP